jgi:hypothetical protein
MAAHESISNPGRRPPAPQPVRTAADVVGCRARVPNRATSHRARPGLRKLAAGVGIAAVALLQTSASPHAGAAASRAGTWLFAGLAPAARAAVQADLAQVVPAARPLLQSLAGAVELDSAVSHCRGAATSCSTPHSGVDGRWGIHLDAQTTSATYPSNRFLVYHEIGHAVWGLLLDDAHHQAFARAVRAALHGRPCVDGLGRPCAALGEVFADEFARFAGDFAVSMSFYWTPSIFDPTTFHSLVAVRDS